jgi:D-methionine transport system permease protein
MIESTLNVEQLLQAVWETVFMTFVSLFFATVFGLLIGILLYCTQTGGLLQNKILNRIVDVIVNVLRAIPFLILLILLIPLTRAIVGTMLGARAALPPLIFASTPFFARMCVIAFQDVDKGTIEAAKAMGASNSQIIFKVLLPESMPAIVSGIAVTGISLVGYTAMAGAIGAGGLGNLAYMYGFARRNDAILYSSTVIIVLIVFVIQWIGDAIVKKIDKR